MLLPPARACAVISSRRRRCDRLGASVLSQLPAMRSSHDSPLPGDLVIREQEDRSGVRPLSVFVVTVWPQNETSAGPYLSYSYALRQARQLAGQRRVQVWREHSPGLQNVSED